MSCNFDRALLQEYLDRETSPLESLLLEEHLRACPECQADLEQLQILFQCLEATPEADPPAALEVIREFAVDRFLDEKNSLASQKKKMAAGANRPSLISSIWQSQLLWAGRTVQFINYLPESRVAGKTSEFLGKSGLLAGKAVFNAALKLTAAAAGRG